MAEIGFVEEGHIFGKGVLLPSLFGTINLTPFLNSLSYSKLEQDVLDGIGAWSELCLCCPKSWGWVLRWRCGCGGCFPDDGRELGCGREVSKALLCSVLCFGGGLTESPFSLGGVSVKSGRLPWCIQGASLCEKEPELKEE